MMLIVTHASENRAQAWARRLINQFQNTHVFWEQFDIAKEIVALHDPRVLRELVRGLSDEDRHLRGNAAFVFASLGDKRGFDVIYSILTDRSDRPAGQGIVKSGGIFSPGTHPNFYRVEQQIAADRYYAAHLLGDLKDSHAVPILIPLLDDADVNFIVPWALSEIGDERAVMPLIKALTNSDPSIRVLAILALKELDAKEAIPALFRLLNDNASSTFGDLKPVATASREAIAHLEALH